jgi:hypothetical protein
MKSILQALAKFQETCPAVVKSSNNPFFKSKYAPLEDIQRHIKPHLKSCGLVVTQANVVIDGSPYVESRVWDVVSGENIVSQFPVIVGKVSAQDYGSAVSYAKRYSLTGLLNIIVADEDDDASSISVGNNNVSTTQGVSSATPELPSLDAEKYDLMVKYINDGKIKEVESAIKKYKLTDPQKKLLTSLINQSKAEAITKSAKK